MNRKVKHKKDEPLIKKHLCINVATLIQCAKNSEHLKLYAIQSSLYSLFKNKVILNYEDNYSFLSHQIGFSVAILKKYIPKLLELKLCDSKDGKHLHIGSVTRFMKFLDMDEYFYCDPRIVNKKSKFIRCVTTDHLTVAQLEAWIIELSLNQKYKNIIKDIYGSSLSKVLKYKYRTIIKGDLLKTCANGDNSAYKLHLTLKDIQRIFALQTKQGSSMKLLKLASLGLITSKKQFKYIRKLKTGENLNRKDLPSNIFIKEDWLVEQLPNRLSFAKRALSIWWIDIFDEFFEKLDKIKSKKFKTLIEINKSKANTNEEKLNHFLKNPLQFSKKKFKESFIDKITGELVFENYFYVFRDLLVSGVVNHTIYLNKYKFLELKSYKKLREIVE